MCARRLACELVDPESVSPLMACRLVALDKCPGIPRCIMAKAILSVVRDDVQQAAGSLQLCAGQIQELKHCEGKFRDGGH